MLQSAQGNTRKITDDVAALRPTLFIAVPRVLERIQAGIDAKVQHCQMHSLPRRRHLCGMPAPVHNHLLAA
jgi:long-subunit acyl-CoA synthetase (AMP-forming)